MLIKNFAGQKFTFFARSVATGAGVTGLDFTTTISKDGGAFSATANADSEISGGWYTITLSQSETNCDILALKFTCSDPLVLEISHMERTQDLNSIASSVWGLDSAFTVSGSFGDLLSIAKAAVDTEVAAIKAKTDNLPPDPADASDIAAAFSTVNSTLATINGYIDTEVAAIKAKTDLLTFTGTDVRATMDGEKVSVVEADVRTAIGLAAANLDTQLTALAAAVAAAAIRTALGLATNNLDTQLSTIDTIVDAIKVKTDLIPASPVSTTDLTSTESLIVAEIQTNRDDVAAVDAKVDLVQADVTAIKTKTDNLPVDTATELDDIDAAIVAIPDAPSAADVADAVWDELLVGHVSVGSTGRKLFDLSGGGGGGTSVSISIGTAVSSQIESLTNMKVDQFAGRPVAVFKVVRKDEDGVEQEYDLTGKVVRLVLAVPNRGDPENAEIIASLLSPDASLTISGSELTFDYSSLPEVTARAGTFVWYLWEIDGVYGNMLLGRGNWMVSPTIEGDVA